MKKNNILIVILVIFLLAILGFIISDFFSEEKEHNNVYEYNLDDFQNNNPDIVSYHETGSFPVKVDKVKGIATDSQDNIFVSGQGSINIYDKDGSIITEFTTGTKGGPLEIQDGKIYHGAWDHIDLYDYQGNRIQSWNKEDEKSIITSIAIQDTNLWIADAGARLVYHYNTSGNKFNQIGEKEKSPDKKGFIIPSPYFDVAIGRNDEIWIVNPGRHRLESYTPDGDFRYSWNKTSMGLDGFSGCCNPTNIALMEDGSFVTTEKGLVRIKIHEPNGDFRTLVADQSSFDKGTTGLDVTIDSQGRILVLDPSRKEVRIFEKK